MKITKNMFLRPMHIKSQDEAVLIPANGHASIETGNIFAQRIHSARPECVIVGNMPRIISCKIKMQTH